MAEQRYAVLIGNGKYDPGELKLPPLRCPAQDVAGLSELLTSETHGPYHVFSLVDASHDKILETIFDVLITRADKDDLVLLYYSGHGKPDQNGDLYLAAANTCIRKLPLTAVPLYTIGPWMKQSKSRKVVLILDCCYSGAVERLFTRGEVSDQIVQALPKQLAGRGTYVLTASTDVQMAEEKEGERYGLLTKHIISGIRDGEADRDDDGIVTMNELLTYVQDRVTAEGSQTPQGYALQTEGGQLVIARTGKAARSKRYVEVRNAILSQVAAHHVPNRVLVAVLNALDPVNVLSEDDKRVYDQRLERFHRTRGDDQAFLAEIYDTYESRLQSQSQQAPPISATEEVDLGRQKAGATRLADKRAAERQAAKKAKRELIKRRKAEAERLAKAKAKRAAQAKTEEQLVREKAVQARRPVVDKVEPERLADRGEQAEAHYDRGQFHHNKRELEEAIAAYRTALELNPNHTNAHVNLGIVLSEMGLLDEAIVEYRKALKLNPHYRTVLNFLGEALLSKAEALHDKGDLDGAVAAYRDALQVNQSDADAHHRLGTALSDLGLLDEAIEELRKAVELKPDYRSFSDVLVAELLNKWGVLYDKGDLDGAISACHEALRVDPNSASAHTWIGITLGLKGDLQGATTECRQAVRISPKDPVAQNSLGMVLTRIGDLDGAIDACREALRLDPKMADAHHSLGEALETKGQRREALEEYGAACNLDPQNPQYRAAYEKLSRKKSSWWSS